MFRVFRWSQRPQWRDYHQHALDRHIGWVTEDLKLERDGLADMVGTGSLQQVTVCALEDLATMHFEPERRNLIDDYLSRRGWSETASAREYLLAVRDSVMSLYEVQDTEPGRSMVLKDLLRHGEPFTVNERLGSRQLVRWDALACRLVRTSEGLVMTGGILLFPRHWMADDPQKEFRKLARSARKRGLLEAPDVDSALNELLRNCAFLLSHLWLESFVDAVSAPPPELRNFDGHKIVFTNSRFSFEPENRQAIIGRLDDVPSLTRQGDEQTRWIWQRGAFMPMQLDAGVGLGAGNGEFFERRTLGTLVLDKNSLLIESNSVERGEQGRKLITEALGELVKPGLVSTEDARKALAESRGKPKPREREKRDEVPADVRAEVLAKFKDRHYREWVDDELPVLDGQTPRQASRSKAGRAKLISLLKGLENNELHRAREDGIAPYETAWIWEALGLSRDHRPDPASRPLRKRAGDPASPLPQQQLPLPPARHTRTLQ